MIKDVSESITNEAKITKWWISWNILESFIKEWEASGIIGSLAKYLNKILFAGYKMNDMINNFLLAEDKFMTEMHLRQPGLT